MSTILSIEGSIGSIQSQRPPPPMSTAASIPTAGIALPPSSTQPPPLPSSSGVGVNTNMHGGAAAPYPSQYPGQPPLPPTGMYPSTGKLTVFSH